MLHPLVGGLPPEVGWKRLERFVNDILPKIGMSTPDAFAGRN